MIGSVGAILLFNCLSIVTMCAWRYFWNSEMNYLAWHERSSPTATKCKKAVMCARTACLKTLDWPILAMFIQLAPHTPTRLKRWRNDENPTIFENMVLIRSKFRRGQHTAGIERIFLLATPIGLKVGTKTTDKLSSRLLISVAGTGTMLSTLSIFHNAIATSDRLYQSLANQRLISCRSSIRELVTVALSAGRCLGSPRSADNHAQ